MRRNGPTRHPFVEDTDDPDPLWDRCLRCSLPRQNEIHDLPERTDEERATTARMVGERA